jgi:hypothetical protein
VEIIHLLCAAPIELMESLDLKWISYQTSLLRTLALAKHVGELYALSVHPFCTQFALGDCKVTWRANVAFTPNVMSMSYRSLALSYFPFHLILLLKSNRGYMPCFLCELHRGLAAYWVLFKVVTMEDICAAVSWASPHTFVRFYRLDINQSIKCNYKSLFTSKSVLTAGTGERH